MNNTLKLKAIIGILLILSPFVAIFIIATMLRGVLLALLVFGITAFVIGIITLGLYLIMK